MEAKKYFGTYKYFLKFVNRMYEIKKNDEIITMTLCIKMLII